MERLQEDPEKIAEHTDRGLFDQISVSHIFMLQDVYGKILRQRANTLHMGYLMKSVSGTVTPWQVFYITLITLLLTARFNL